MLKIDNSLLVEVGLGGLPDAEKNNFLKHIYETLEMRVGVRLADQMTNEQLDEFERYFEAKDDAGAFKWLETNFPNYKEIVQQEFDKLKNEVAQSAPQILAASQAQAAQAQAQAQVQPQTVQAPPVQPQPLAPTPPPAQPVAAPAPLPQPPQPPQAPMQPLTPTPPNPGLDIVAPQGQPQPPVQSQPYAGDPLAQQPPTPPPAPNPAPTPEPVPPMMPPFPHEQPPAGPGPQQ